MALKPIVIDGAHAALLNEFVAYKRNLGYGYPHQTMELIRRFSRFLSKFPLEDDILTKELIDVYCEPIEGEAMSTRSKRLSLSRQFALFLRTTGIQCYVPPEQQQQKKSTDFVPYIISEIQMADIIKCADRQPFFPHTCTTKAVYSMLLRLLWCCGLRLSEALHLRLDDVDIDSGVITVRRAKYDQIRLIPISNTLHDYINRYWDEMRFPLKEADDFFFPTHRDTVYDRATAGRHIKKIMFWAGVTKDGIRPPRVHDIRHSYAVRALKKMNDENIDIYCALPMLSIFMGHSDIKSTEYYLRLTGHVFSDIAASMDSTYTDVFPEVCDEDE
jgi:integrase